METVFRVLLLGAAALALPGCAWMLPGRGEDVAAQEEIVLSSDEEPTLVPPRVIEPEVERREVRVARIDAENIEVGAFYGALSIEDFGTGPVQGLTAAYHVTEDIFFEAAFGRSKAGRTSYETLGGNVQLLTPSERRFTYYSLSLGYNLLPGEVYIGRSLAMTSALYLMGGVGSTEFAGDQRFTLNFGAGYRLLPTDWLAVHIEVQDRVFQSDLLGRDKLTNNISAHLGLTVFF
ncbi:MAG: outer membrane beta-barrel domain-containing protein [Pseudomonadota bacterium]|jgi:outer membrane beta-barrel protein|nr:MAG: outer membrane beta-barrel domain-containing protein [Pseudomonadota bacterium]